MAAIINKAFGGERPILQPRLLNDTEAQLARNVRLVSGRIEPLKGPTTLKALTNALATTIFRYGNSETETNYWLEWTDHVHVARSPIANDQYDRVYWTGENHGNVSTGYPRYAPNSLVLTGASYPGGSYRLGLPKPANTITASGTAVTNPTVVTREYIITYADAASSPTMESLPSKVYKVSGVDGGDVVFTDLPDSNEGDTRVTHKRLYRKLSGTYRLVVTLALADLTYTDSMTDATLAGQSALSPTLANAIGGPAVAPRAAAATGSGTVETTETRTYQVTLIGGTYTDGNGDTISFAESWPSAEYGLIGVYQNQSATISVTIPAGIDYTHVCLYRKRGTETVPTLVNRVAKGLTPTVATITDNPDIAGTTSVTANAPNPSGIDSSKKPTISSTAAVTPYTPSNSTQGRVYCVTYANASSNESPPSPDSNVVTVVDGSTVTVSHVEALPTGVTVKRIYRKQQNEAISAYRRVIEVPASQTSYTDTATASSISGNASIPAGFQSLLAKPTETAVVEGKVPAKKVPESRTYVYTYVTVYGEEGPPSAASTVIDIDPDQAVSISNMSAAPSGPYNVNKKRIYRSSTVGNQAQFQFVDEIDVADLTYSDTKTQSDLGEVLPSEAWEAPPAKLFNLRIMANGIACGFVKDDVSRTVVLSEAYLPHAWPPEYSFTTDDTIVGIGVFRQSIAVLTKSFPYIIYGVDPAAMSMTKLELQQACVSAKSIVETGDGVIYASPDGLIMISGNGVQNITQSIFTREQWQDFNPSSMKCFLHDGRIHILYTTAASARGTLIMDLSGQGATLTQADIQTSPNSEIVGGYYDPRTDTLYWIQGGNIVRHNRGSDLTYLWRSKLHAATFPLNYSCAQVQAETYPVTLKVYAGGVLKLTKSVANNNIFTLPSGFRASDWYYEVTGTAKVYGVSLAQSPLEIKAT
jgi:hypothetical protein